jgi:hypothetical protein
VTGWHLCKKNKHKKKQQEQQQHKQNKKTTTNKLKVERDTLRTFEERLKNWHAKN